MTKLAPYEIPEHRLLVALYDYANAHGPGWKSALQHDWLVGCKVPELQELRNEFGPRWLTKVSGAWLEQQIIGN